jgi:hypothetical protein
MRVLSSPMFLRRVLPNAALLAIVAACHRTPPPSETSTSFDSWGIEDGGLPRTLEGSLLVGRRAIDMGVYLPTVPSTEQLAAVQETAKERLPAVTVLSGSGHAAPPTALVLSPDVKDLPPPTLEMIRFDGRGFFPGQAEAVVASKGLVAIVLRLDDDPGLARLRATQQLALATARAGGGVIWDEATREVYAADEWQKVRVDGWEGDRPEVRRHIALHYDNSAAGGHRLTTHGMQKLGLPDLVLTNVLPNEIGSATRVLDGAAQLLAEGATLGPGGVLRFDLDAVQHQGARRAFESSAGTAILLSGPVTLVPVAPEPGDPDNRIVAIRFPVYDGFIAAERAGAAAAKAARDAGATRDQ